MEQCRNSDYNEDDMPCWRSGLVLDLFVEMIFKWFFCTHLVGAENQVSLFFSSAVWLQVVHSVLDVERPLIQGQLSDIDAQLRKAEDSLNWNSQGLHIYWLVANTAPDKWHI